MKITSDPNTWESLFDKVAEMLERGQLPEGIDVFKMGVVHEPHNCGTAACFFGSAAHLAGLRGSNARKAWFDWRPTPGFMDSLQDICLGCATEGTLAVAVVVSEYKELKTKYSEETKT